jgi:hypothetical protein
MNKYEYADLLTCVEVQHTFYQPPHIKTLEKWRGGDAGGLRVHIESVAADHTRIDEPDLQTPEKGTHRKGD